MDKKNPTRKHVTRLIEICRTPGNRLSESDLTDRKMVYIITETRITGNINHELAKSN